MESVIGYAIDIFGRIRIIVLAITFFDLLAFAVWLLTLRLDEHLDGVDEEHGVLHILRLIDHRHGVVQAQAIQ